MAEVLVEKPKLGIVAAASYMIGNVIGSGIFISPTLILADTGTIGGNLLVWLLCGIITILGSLAYIELGTSIPRSGSDYAYLCYVKWYPIAFGVGIVSILLSWPGSIAVLSGVFGEYVIKAIQPWVCLDNNADKDRLQTIVAILFMISIAVLNFGRLDEWLTRFQVFTTALKIGVTLIIVIAGIYYAAFKDGVDHFHKPFGVLDDKDGHTIESTPVKYVLAMYGGFWAYVGWDTLNNGIEEIHNPPRTLPLAACGGLIVITIIYVLVNCAYISVLGPQPLLASLAVAQTFTQKVFGNTIALCVPFIIAVVVANTINAGYYSGSRYLFVVSRQGHIPKFMALLHIGTDSPRVGVVVLTFLSIILLLSGTVEVLLKLVVFVQWLSHVFALIAILYIRWKGLPVHPRAIRMPLPIHIIFLILCIALVVIPFVDRPLLTGIGVGLTAFFVVAFTTLSYVFHEIPEFVRQAGDWTLKNMQKLTMGKLDMAKDNFSSGESQSESISTSSSQKTIVERF